MPIRNVSFANGYYYHVYNRGVNKRKIFLDNQDHQRAIDTLQYYLYSGHRLRFSYYRRLNDQLKQEYSSYLMAQTVGIVSYVLMPNHFHFLINQLEDGGISNCLRLFENSYTRYFNTKHKRIGPLLQGPFKAVTIESDSQLLHVTRYIHLNPFSSKLVDTTEKLERYPWSSYPSYLKTGRSQSFINNEIILDQFKNQSYRTFVNERSLYQQELEEIKHLTIE